VTFEFTLPYLADWTVTTPSRKRKASAPCFC